MSRRMYSMSIGLSRPDSSSSSMQSKIVSDWEPIAAREASRGRHLGSHQHGYLKDINE